MTTYKCQNCGERFALEITRMHSKNATICPFCHGAASRCAYKDGCIHCGGVLRNDGRCYACGRIGRPIRA
jgi:predicted nucleic acid-binding Zn ribbon protein